MRKFRVGIAVLLTAAMAGFGVGCTNPPSTEAEAQQVVAWLGTSIAGLILIALCQNTAFCPIPGDPALPPPASP